MIAPTAFEIAEWLAGRVAESTGESAASIDHFAAFEALGLDSATVVTLSGELEDLLDREVDPTMLFDHACIHDLAVALEEAESWTST